MVKSLLLLAVALGTCTLGAADLQPIYKLAAPALAARVQTDAQSVAMHRQGLREVIEFIHTQPEIFPATTPIIVRLLRRDEKEMLWQAWQRFLDYTIALDSTERYHANWWRLKGNAREDSFLVSYAAMLAKYRAALEWLDRADHNPELDKVLNDAVPELGLPAGTYARLKLKYLNVAIASEFAAREVVLKTFSGQRQTNLLAAIASDSAAVWKAGHGRGEVLQVKNALNILKRGAGQAWLPIQAGVSEWMGDTKVYRISKSLVSQKQIEELQPRLCPGDVVLVRHEWYLSNIGLPGFWPHAMLYIGTPAERAAFFNDEATRSWARQQGEARGELESLLASRSPEAYRASIAATNPVPIRIIEAISEGVSLTPVEHALDVDSLAVLRPRLPKVERAQAILRAFHYVGRPYDFDFDFSTDAALVCTELVYKSYEPARNFTGLQLPTVTMLGRQVTPANEFAKQFDAQAASGTAQFELIEFLDGNEHARRAEPGSLAEFRASWKRPKWHVLK